MGSYTLSAEVSLTDPVDEAYESSPPSIFSKADANPVPPQEQGHPMMENETDAAAVRGSSGSRSAGVNVSGGVDAAAPAAETNPNPLSEDGSFSFSAWWKSSNRRELEKAEQIFLEGIPDIVRRDVQVSRKDYIHSISAYPYPVDKNGRATLSRTAATFVPPSRASAGRENEKPLSKDREKTETASTADLLTWKLKSTISDSRGISNSIRSSSTSSASRARPQHASMKHILLLPGYGMGCATYALAIVELRKRFPEHAIHATDWLGFGLSSRPPWDHDAGVELVERFFVIALDNWRQQLKIEKFDVLVGHSIGGYLGVVYAERYPTRVAHLCLASPCGIARKPDDSVMEKALDKHPWYARVFLNTIKWGWENHFTPMELIRLLGTPLGGRALMKEYAKKRFSDNGQWKKGASQENLGHYLYHVWTADEGSAEFMLSALLSPGVFAKHPLGDRIVSLQVGAISLCYGSTDWMDCDAGLKLVKWVEESWKPVTDLHDFLKTIEEADEAKSEPGKTASWTRQPRPQRVSSQENDSENRASLDFVMREPHLRSPTTITDSNIRSFHQNFSDDEKPHPIASGSVCNFEVGPDQEVLFVANAGHMLYLENPHEFAGVVEKLVRKPNLVLRKGVEATNTKTKAKKQPGERQGEAAASTEEKKEDGRAAKVKLKEGYPETVPSPSFSSGVRNA